jgi:hypothetical protein
MALAVWIRAVLTIHTAYLTTVRAPSCPLARPSGHH